MYRPALRGSMYWECNVCCNCFFEDAGLTVAPALTLPGPHGSGATSTLFRASCFVLICTKQKPGTLPKRMRIHLRFGKIPGNQPLAPFLSRGPRGPQVGVRPSFSTASTPWRMAPPCRIKFMNNFSQIYLSSIL